MLKLEVVDDKNVHKHKSESSVAGHIRVWEIWRAIIIYKQSESSIISHLSRLR